MSQYKSARLGHSGLGNAIARDNILYTTEALLGPLVIVLVLWLIAFMVEGGLAPAYLILSLILFSLTFPSSSKVKLPIWEVVSNVVINWIIISTLLISFGIASGYIELFSVQAILLWIWLTPLCQLGADFALRSFAPMLVKLQGPVKQTIIIGKNEQGIALAERLSNNDYIAADLLGFFDSDEQATPDARFPLLGKLEDIQDYVKTHRVNVIYLCLPASKQEEIIHLLDELKDTTASIYFVPDIFHADLIQARAGQIEDIPVVAVCETPFTGFNGLIKRTADIVFSLGIIILISPLLIAIAIGVKLCSPGPVIFKQRRYGLYGEEILVFKFRSMTVCEDGSKVTQATKNDQRITPFGAFLRKTSLDELPQFFNVLQGCMSIVGPRPHAVAHNEMYRKLIK
ncbi:MAG: exopolysaccharide biosynthesis polyprenyl glycosylphosphotransferase, partial [Nitrosomonadales bacterium]|nr:exopolysaccharide biosynthesis polyprenyl glycosylphosphotransferase [Nitrosomonadales bacterium]